jgi:RHS repeat-associated protein
MDAETGLYDMRSRYYHPGLGRFLTPDDTFPTSLPRADLLHRYAYAYGDPLVHYDPSGHFSLSSLWHHVDHWIVKNWQWAVSFAVDVELVTYGLAVMATTPFGGPASGLLGATLLGAGIGGMAYDITQLATHKSFSWKDWGIQLGIGGATGLVSGGFAVAAGAVVDAAAQAGRTAFYVGGVARLAVNTAAATVGSTVSGLGGQMLNNAARGRRWDQGLGWAAYSGAALGFAGGALGELAAARFLTTNTVRSQQANDDFAEIVGRRSFQHDYELPPVSETRAGVTWGTKAGWLVVALPGASFSGIDAFFTGFHVKPKW